MEKKLVKKLRKDGLVIVENVFTTDECKKYKEKIIKILERKITKNQYVGNNEYQVIENYFTFDDSFFKIIYSELIEQIMVQLIDQDYVILSSSARNSHLNKKIKFNSKTSGIGWHTDTRYIQEQRIRPSLIYTSIVPLEDFNLLGGTTEFIVGSHKFKGKPEREKDYKNANNLIAKKGSLIVIDTALWHRAGIPTNKSRWAIFTMYAPWFIKPYFQFDKIIPKNKVKNLHPKVRQLLHFDSIPPRVHNSSNLATLKRVRAELKKAHFSNKK